MKPRLLALCLLLTGTLIFAGSLSLPYYKNNKPPYQELQDDSGNYEDRYYGYEEAYRTNKTDLMDFGSGLCVASATVLIFLFLTKTKSFADFKNIRTPGALGIFIVANAAWLLAIPGTYFYYTYRAGRGDYPPFADSIAIPICTQVPFYLLMLLLLNFFILCSVVQAKLPAFLLIRAKRYDAGRIMLEVFFGFFLLINLWCLYCVLIDGDHFIIVTGLVFVYIILSLRAGNINSFNYSTGADTE